MNSSSSQSSNSVETEEAIAEKSSEQWFNEQFDNLLPKIQERWPDLARQTLEATKGSLDELINVISLHSGNNDFGVKEQLEEIFHSASDKTRDLAESLEPLEKQLEDLLDELNSTLRPRIERPIRKRPLFAIGIAAGIGVLFGILLSGGKRN
ncbi:hypothetical protein DNJ73_00570 [Prochlorococcus marinus XMU1408]|uniref:DUF883 domain-containing protein n=1 Tax=Prochlorococcus marinus XMU1408 TaxID=2213228 RepID=A0A318R899_PROMR|nr:hypothetical protein [Prochlorococcus marinus str. XMU1408]PYE03880.1 hypothetical protein DNJ73_00570 [Prochlorococcus marinus XMU1408]